jgi:hypothetical protein
LLACCIVVAGIGMGGGLTSQVAAANTIPMKHAAMQVAARLHARVVCAAGEGLFRFSASFTTVVFDMREARRHLLEHLIGAQP